MGRSRKTRALHAGRECPRSAFGVSHSVPDSLKSKLTVSNAGAPDPTGKETSFGRARRVEPTNDSETEELEAIGQTAPEAAVATLRGDEKLGLALHAIASGQGDEIDPAAISRTLFSPFRPILC